MNQLNQESYFQELVRDLSNPRLYVRTWFHRNGVQILPNGDVIKGGHTALMKDVQNTAWLDYRDQLIAAASELPNGRRVNRFKKDDFLAATDEYSVEVATAFRETTIKETACTGEDLSELRRFVVAVAGDESADLNLAILAHFLWQVKRKMRRLPVESHLMPILFGAQNAGKTVALNCLLAPIEQWMLPTSLPGLQDERRAFALGQNFVAFCDEIQQAQKADVEVLKNIITAAKVTPRVMRENTVSKVPQNCTFVGATNKSIAELIYDPTGMRRFAEIRTLDRLDWKVINSIDYCKLFRGIDEGRGTPYIAPFREKLACLQVEYAADDPIITFLEDSGLLDGADITRTEFVSCAAVYAAYVNWCADNGYKNLSHGPFGKSARARGLALHGVKRGHDRVRGYRVSNAVAARLMKTHSDRDFLNDLGEEPRAER